MGVRVSSWPLDIGFGLDVARSIRLVLAEATRQGWITVSQSGTDEPITTSAGKVAGVLDHLAEPAPPLGKLVAAIREYVTAERLGESEHRRHDLSVVVGDLCSICREKWHEHEMCCTDGTSACVVWTYSTISVQYKNREGEDAGGLLKPRRHSDPPSKLDRDLDDIGDDIARARHETAFGIRMPDKNGRPLPAAAIDRLLALADRIESQEGSAGSAAVSDVEVKPSTVTDDAASIEAKVPSENGVLNETSVDTHGDENYVLQRDDVLILEALEGTGQAMTQVEIEAYKNTMPSRGTIGKRLERMRKAGYIRRPHGDRGGDTITNDGKAALKKTSCSTQH